MPSLQNSAGAGKAAKFVAANPLGPMANPFSDSDNAASELQEKLSADVDKRLNTAMEELKEKHATGTNDVDDEDRAPTGTAYRAQAAETAERRRKAAARKRRDEEEDARRRASLKEEARSLFDHNKNGDDDDSVDSDDELLRGLDDDPELEAIRDRRIAELRRVQLQKVEDLAKGHGQYRTITQDEFLKECVSSDYVAVHFYHDEFRRCTIMDHHLRIIAPLHTNCKFLRIDAAKAPFFVGKLQVKTLPTLLVFQEGKAVDRLTGFEGLAKDKNDPDKWHTGRLRQWIATTGAIQYEVPTEEIREEMERLGMRPRGTVWSGFQGEGTAAYDDE